LDEDEAEIEAEAEKPEPPLPATEEEAVSLYHRMSNAFGWAGSIFTRADVEDIAGKVTEEQWEAVQQTYAWRKGVPERLTETGWDQVHMAVDEAGIPLLEEEEDDSDDGTPET
jgi:hypothetical protein